MNKIVAQLITAVFSWVAIAAITAFAVTSVGVGLVEGLRFLRNVGFIG